jgi:hypothetical protein
MKNLKSSFPYLLTGSLVGFITLSLLALPASRRALTAALSERKALDSSPQAPRSFRASRRATVPSPLQFLTQPTTIGVWRPSNSTFYLRNSSTAGAADFIIPFGQTNDLPLTGDWDGNGDDTIGVFRPSNNTFYLRNSNTPGAADIIVQFGQSGDLPVVGDWDGNGTVTIGVYRQGQTFLLRNSNTPGAADITLQFGTLNGSPIYGGAPLAGDWDGNGTVTLGIHKPATDTFYFRNALSQGPVDVVVTYGQSGTDAPVTGDWDGNLTRTIGYYHLSDQSFHLRNANSGGPDALSFTFGQPGDVPVAGRWTRSNQPPTTDAGPDQMIMLPTNIASLNGTVTDDGLPVGGALTIEWSKVSGPGTVTFGNPNQAMTTATFSAAGSYVLRLTANDSQLSGSDDVTITVSAGLTVNAGSDQVVTLPDTALLSGTISGGAGAITTEWSKVSGPDAVIFSNASALSTTATFRVGGVYVLRLTAQDSQVTVSDDVTVTVNEDPTPPPPDPMTVAPPVDMTVATTIGSATEFLYTGPNPIQTGVAPGTINPVRAAVLKGRVLDRSNNPLSLVKITILNHPEYGQTLSRADGRFDMAVNGGGVLTAQYEKPGFQTVQRTDNVPWQDYCGIPDVVMSGYDSQVTFIDLLASTPVQVAQSSVSTDTSGTRRTTLLFKQGTTATMKLPGGAMQGLDKLHVRATEFTVGANGPNAMPGDLPANSAYTYAVEYSLDEAVAANATETTFSQPVVQYNENFLNFPVGIDIPSGAYDRATGQWIASASGRVVKILSITSGTANLDVTGSGSPATQAQYDALGINTAERQTLATLYTVNQSLWRVPVIHFSPWDSNWPYGPPPDAEPPDNPPPQCDT